MAFKDLFKRKEGGTVIGNILRGVTNTVAKVISPALGKVVGVGILAKKAGETPAQANTRAAEIATAGAAAGVVAASDQNQAGPGQSVILMYVKKFWWVGLFPVAGLLFLIFKPKRRR